MTIYSPSYDKTASKSGIGAKLRVFKFITIYAFQNSKKTFQKHKLVYYELFAYLYAYSSFKPINTLIWGKLMATDLINKLSEKKNNQISAFKRIIYIVNKILAKKTLKMSYILLQRILSN